MSSFRLAPVIACGCLIGCGGQSEDRPKPVAAVEAPAAPARVAAKPKEEAKPKEAKLKEEAKVQGKTVKQWLEQAVEERVNGESHRVLASIGPSPSGEPVDEAILQALEDALQGKDDTVRFLAGETLRHCGKEAIPHVLAAMKNKDARVRSRAVAVFSSGHHGIGLQMEPADLRPAVPVLASMMAKDPSRDVRSTAAMALSNIGAPAVPALIDAAKSDDVETRKLAIGVLGRGGPQAKKVVPVLIEATKDEETRMLAVQGLNSIGEDAADAVPTLIALTKDRTVGHVALQALPRLGKPPKTATPALVALLKDDDMGVRLRAAIALGQLEVNGKEARTVLIEMLKTRDVKVRDAAAQELGKYGPEAKDAVTALIWVIHDGNSGTARHSAIRALGAIGPDAKEAIPALKALELDNGKPDPTVVAALKAIDRP